MEIKPPEPFEMHLQLELKSTQYKKLAPNALWVRILKFGILQTTWKNKTKNIKMINLLVKNWKLRVWCSLFHFFHVICKISNFNMWTTKHLVQASCTELTLLAQIIVHCFLKIKKLHIWPHCVLAWNITQPWIGSIKKQKEIEFFQLCLTHEKNHWHKK